MDGIAVSLEGIYKLIDRASPTLEKIERRAAAADRAIDKLGRSMDKLAARQAIAKVENLTGNIGKLEAQTAKTERTMNRASGASGGMNRNFDRTSGTTRRLTGDMGRFESLMRKVVVISTGFMKVLAPAKITLILVAIRPLLGAVAALGAGAVALGQQLGSAAGALVPVIARMGDLAGVGVAAVGVLLSVKAATITTKFAFDGMKEAINGNAEAMKRLTPEARAFAKEMRSLQPVMNTIRSSAQRGLFPGLTGALSTARKNGAFRTLNAAAGGIGKAVGGVAQQAANRLTDPAALRDSLQQAQTFAFVITHLGTAGVNLANVFRNILFAAQPLTRWLATTVQGWTEYLDRQVQIGRASGSLARYFERTRASLTRIGHAARDFGVAFLNILRVARGESKPLGQDLAGMAKSFRTWTESFQNQARVALWFERAQKSAHTLGGTLVNLTRVIVGIGGASRRLGTGMNRGIEETTRRWADWVNSFRGQNEIGRWMNGMRSTLKELWGLVSDIGGAFGRLGAGGGGAAGLLRQMRDLIPDLEGVLKSLNANLGPGLFGTLKEIAHLLATLTMAGSSPLGMFLRATSDILENVNNILDRFKLVRVAAATAVTVITGALLLRKLAQIAGGVSAIAGAWGRVTGATVVAERAAATYGGVAAAAGGGVGMFGRMNPRIAGKGGTAAGGKMSRFGGMGGIGLGIGLPIAVGVGAQALQSSGVIGGHTAGILGGAATGAGTGALLGSVVPGFGTAIGGIVGGVIGAGLADRSPSVSAQNLQHLQESAGRRGFDITQSGGGAQNLAGANRYQRILDQNLTGLRQGQQKAPDVGNLKGQYDTAIAAVQKLRGENIQLLGQERHRQKVLAEQTVEMQKQAQARSSRSIAGNLLNEYGQAYNIYRKGGKTVQQATHLTRVHMESRAKTLNPAGARVLFEGGTKWLNEMQKQHPEVKKEYAKWTKDMKTTMKDMGVEVTTSGGKVLSTTTEQWKKIKTAMQSPIEKALQDMGPKFTQLQQQAAAVLIGLGYTPAQAASVIRVMAAGGAGPSAATAGRGGAAASGASSHGHGGSGKARGGRIAGMGLKDTVPIAPGTMAAPGELVVNRHTESKADRMLRLAGGPSLGALVAGETRRHDQDILPDAGIMGFAKGGRLGAAIREANRLDSLKIPYKWGGGHSNPAPANGPFDCSSATSRVLQAAGYDVSTRTSGGFVNWGEPGPGAIGIAANAGHVYMVLNGKAWGTSASNPRGGPGWINSYVYRPGFTIRHAPGAGGAGGAFAQDATGPGGLPLMGALNYSSFGQGLGGMPLAATVRGGHAVAVGLQGKINERLARMGEQETNPRQAHRATGGRVEWGGWHGGGLNRTFDRPTMIGVGERGSEHVSVTPTSSGGGRGGPLIHIEHLEVHGGGSSGSVRREVEEALNAVARDLERAPAVGGA